MTLQEIIELDKQYYMNTFGNRTPLCFTQGKGISLWDTEGNEYKDFYAGIAVTSLGHSHPALVSAIQKQASELIHCSNIYYNEPQTKLAKLIVDNSCADKVFFGNSGAEANEGAIKLARLYFKKMGFENKSEIITLVNSFHGRTIATLSATGQEKFHKPFTPLLPGFKHIPINDIQALNSVISEKTCAIMLEAIQGESGVNPADKEFLHAVKNICTEKKILLVFDEIQTGLGRTGSLFAYENFTIDPDIFTLAKALGGGVPIGAVCAKKYVADAFQPGDHGSTFGGNPLACAAGVAVIETMLNDNLAENAKTVGSYLKDGLTNLIKKYSIITEVRGLGLMIGIQLDSPVAKVVREKLQDKGFLVGNVGDYIIRLLPPLIITKIDADQLIEAFDAVLGGN
jgi:acetylornithine/N-succinyldiaminopimelate aminotransferase